MTAGVALARRASLGLLAAALASLLALPSPARAAVTFTLIDFDSPGEGFKDTTPVLPVGGNLATTLGGQRRAAFEAALAIWAGTLDSPVPVQVAALFDPLFCSATGATLASAGPACLHRDFDGAPLASTYFPAALANRLHGDDVCPADGSCACPPYDLVVTFNSVVGTTCALPSTWYYGLDANPPPASFDLVTVALHELAHGLGFLTAVDLDSGRKPDGFDDAFMRHLEDHSSGRLYPQMTNEERLAASINTGNLHWVGPATVAASGPLSAGVDTATGHVWMHAPNPAAPGSSVSHFSNVVSPDELMEPFYTGPLHDVGLTRSVMEDLGWGALTCGNGVLDAGETCDDGNARDGDCCSRICSREPSGAACRSADLCTEGGTCDGAGQCLGGAPADCDDANPCTDDACSPGAGCVHFPVTAACDDGLACTTDDACLLGRCAGTWGCSLDTFALYRAATPSGTPKPPRRPLVVLDAFETRVTATDRPKLFGKASGPTLGDIAVPFVHLECYGPKDAPQPTFLRRRVTTATDFGTSILDVTKGDVLCFTALASETAPPADLVAHRIDHVRCYKAKVARGTPPAVQPTLTLANAFESKTVVFKKPVLLCNPIVVQQSGQPLDLIENPSGHLQCYKLAVPGGQPRFTRRTLFTRTRFGFEQLDVVKAKMACVPSSVLAVQPLP